MKKRILARVAALLLAVFALSVSLTVPAFADNLADDGAETEEAPYRTYTYWSELGTSEKTFVYCKPMYRATAMLDANSLGIGSFGSVDDLCLDGDTLYVLDGTASKIYVLDETYHVKNVIVPTDETGAPVAFSGASGVFVKNGTAYVADQKNARILVFDVNHPVVRELPKPDDAAMPKDFNYAPMRVTVDSRGYLYIISNGSYYGALVYSPDMEFLGFYGANTVPVSIGTALKRLVTGIFSTDAKRAASMRSLPFQFTDFAVGPNDFIYTVTTSKEVKGQIKRLNPGGKDVLGKSDFNFGDDIGVTTADSAANSAVINDNALIAIAVDPDGFYYTIERGKGRVFWYDNESNLICVFGTGGSGRKGTIDLGCALAVHGKDVIVADSKSKAVSVFSLTEYGEKVRSAQVDTLNDNFTDTIDRWEDVIREDANNQLAYRGLAKAYLARGDMKQAMYYAKLGADKETYADAFEKRRTSILEQNFTPIFIGIVALVGVTVALVAVKRKKGIVLLKNEKARVLVGSVAHPFASFGEVKEQHMGSLVGATVILALFYLISAISDTAVGFAFNTFDVSDYNSFFVLLRTVALVLLFVVSNWLVCTLMGGIGKMSEIYTVTCYSLMPVLVSMVLGIVFSHILTPDEYVFVTILQAALMLYALFMLIAGLIKVHDFGFGRFLATTAVTLICMLILVFLMFLIFLLAQQMYGWIATYVSEIRYR